MTDQLLQISASRNHEGLRCPIRVASNSTGLPETGLVVGDFSSFSKQFNGDAASTFTPASFTELGNGYYEVELDADTPNDMTDGRVTAVRAGSTINDTLIEWSGAAFFGNLSSVSGTTISGPVTFRADDQLVVVSGGGINEARRLVSPTELESAVTGLNTSSVVVVFPAGRYGIRVSEVTSEITSGLATLNDFDPVNDTVQNVAIVGNMRGTDNAALASTLASALGGTFSGSTDSLEAIRNAIDAQPAAPSASAIRIEMDSNSTQLAGIIEDTGTTIPGLLAALNDLTQAEVQTAVQTVIEANHLDHLFAVNYDPAAKPGIGTALLNELIESDGGVSRFTANALEQAPSGGGGGSIDYDLAAQTVWEYTLSDSSAQLGSAASGLELASQGGGGGGGGFTSTDRQTLNTIVSQQLTSADLSPLSTFDPAVDGVSIRLNGISGNSFATGAIGTAAVTDALLNAIRAKILSSTITGAFDSADTLGAYAKSAGSVADALTTDGAERLADSADLVIKAEVDATTGPASTTTFKTSNATLLALSDVTVLEGRGIYWKADSVNYLQAAVITSAQKTDSDTMVELTVATPNSDGRLLGSLAGAPVDGDEFLVLS